MAATLTKAHQKEDNQTLFRIAWDYNSNPKYIIRKGSRRLLIRSSEARRLLRIGILTAAGIEAAILFLRGAKPPRFYEWQYSELPFWETLEVLGQGEKKIIADSPPGRPNKKILFCM